MLDHGVDVTTADHQRAKQVLGEACTTEDVLDRQRTTGNVRCMLQHRRVARHEAGGGEAEHLPERKIPRHHGEHDAQRPEGDDALARIGLHGFVREKARGVFGEVVAGERAFLRFARPVLDRLAHLARHQHGKVLRFVAQDRRGLAHRLRAFAERHVAPVDPRGMHGIDDAVDLLRRHFVVRCDRFAGCRVDGLERHGTSSVSKRPTRADLRAGRAHPYVVSARQPAGRAKARAMK
jgi:hypothetical protein